MDLASEWQGIMGELKRRRQALTAAVYGEARVEGFDGKVLRLVYPEEQSFHVGMAKEQGHLEKLGAVLEERLGSKPRLEVRAAGGEAPATTAEKSRTRRSAPTEQRRNRRPKRGSPRRGIRTESGGAVAEDVGPEQGEMGDDVIRTQSEVFDTAREFGLFGEKERG